MPKKLMSQTGPGIRQKKTADSRVQQTQPADTTMPSPADSIRGRAGAERIAALGELPTLSPTKSTSPGWKIAKRALKITGGSIAGGGLIFSIGGESTAAKVLESIKILF